MRILIIDDHRLFAQSLEGLILTTDPASEIVLVSSVREVEPTLAQFEPDVVLLDWLLGDQRGDGVIALIRDRRPAAKVVVLTGALTPAVICSALQSGCDGLVTKDRAADELIDAIRSARAGEMVVSPGAAMVALRYQDLHDRFSERDIEIIAAIAQGKSNVEIAEQLYLSPHTVRNHIQRIAARLDVSSRLEVAMAAIRLGLIEAPSSPPLPT